MSGVPWLDIRAKNRKLGDPPSSLLALDPGQTTGWAFFDEGIYVKSGQMPGFGDGVDIGDEIEDLLDAYSPSLTVVEEFRLYPGKTDAFMRSDFPTVKLIGAIEFMVTTLNYSDDIYYQPASNKDAFPDERLKAWGLYQIGKEHARDAIRHGLHFLCFGKYPIRSKYPMK